MFIENDNYTLYFNIIKKAISEERKKNEGVYYENHHIYPRSLFPEKTNDKDNTVLLTAKEHFTCHELLVKFTEGKFKSKMHHALWMMCNATTDLQQRDKIDADKYEEIRILFSQNLKENHHNKGKSIITDKGRCKISATHLGVKRSQSTCDKIGKAHKGKTVSEESKEKIRIKRKLQIITEETKKKIGASVTGEKNGFYGKKHTEETLYNNALSHSKGTYITPWGEFISAKIASENCPYNIQIISQNINKWCKNSCIIKLNISELKGKLSNAIGFNYIPNGVIIR